MCCRNSGMLACFLKATLWHYPSFGSESLKISKFQEDHEYEHVKSEHPRSTTRLSLSQKLIVIIRPLCFEWQYKLRSVTTAVRTFQVSFVSRDQKSLSLSDISKLLWVSGDAGCKDGFLSESFCLQIKCIIPAWHTDTGRLSKALNYR